MSQKQRKRAIKAKLTEDKTYTVRMRAEDRYTTVKLPKAPKRVYLRYDTPRHFRGITRWYIWWPGGHAWFEDAMTSNRSRWCCEAWLAFNGWVEDPNQLHSYTLAGTKHDHDKAGVGGTKQSPELQLPGVAAWAPPIAGRIPALPA